MKRLLRRQLVVISLLLLPFSLFLTPVAAQIADPFENGWTLNAEASELRFMSIKKGNKAESNSFAKLAGLITEGGEAQIRVFLDSVDTKIDLRNVRMRFLFFETFLYPEATITARLDPELLNDLSTTRRKLINLDYTLSLHGVTVDRSAEVAIALINNDRVTVSATTPIALTLNTFNLEGGQEKLQEAAKVTIVPLGIVSFDFVFDRTRPGTPPVTELVTETVAPGTAAVETKGNLDRAACAGRFEILSRTGNINFATGSASLAHSSRPLLNSIYDIVDRCPDLRIEIGGYTDSDGSTSANQRLSERRAKAVASYLQNKGIAADRMKIVGYGEESPLFPNTSKANKAKNRRIGFLVLN